jgi:hypothetical protein
MDILKRADNDEGISRYQINGSMYLAVGFILYGRMNALLRLVFVINNRQVAPSGRRLERNYMVRVFSAILTALIIACGNNPYNPSLPQKTSRASFAPNTWHLVSFPVHPMKTEALLPPDIIVRYWDETRPADSIYSYYAGRDAIDSVRPGHGYWIKCSTEVAFSLDTVEEFMEESLCVTIRKNESGWNMVGNPYAYPIAVPDNHLTFYRWETASDLSPLLLSKKLFTADKLSVALDADWDSVVVLEPWRGYFVKCEQDSTVLVFRNPAGRT